MKLFHVASVQDIDALYSRVKDNERSMVDWEEHYQSQIDKLQTDKAREIDGLKEENEAITIKIFEFLEQNRKELFPGKVKSIKLALCRIGFRESTGLSIADSKKTIAKIKAFFKAKSKFVIQISESLKKPALKGWTDRDLKKIGVVRWSEEKAYIDPLE